VVLTLGHSGYDFGNPVKIEADSKAPSKKKRKQVELEAILAMKEPPHISIDRVMKKLDCDYNTAYSRLRELVLNNKLEKFGKGKKSIYKHATTSLA
jgi:predicted transcriptional regulator